MRVMRTVKTALIPFISWFLIFWYLDWTRDITQTPLWNALISAGAVFFVYWWISTGRLTRMFRRVN